MPSVKRGSTGVTAIRRGGTVVSAVRRGNVLVWSPSSMYDPFDRDDAADIDPTELIWADDTSSSEYTAGVVNGTCRFALPDGLVGYGFTSVRRRFVGAEAGGDDGHLEVKVATTGSAGFTTDVFRRVSNSASTHGVGIRLEGGNLSIVRRVASVDTVMVACGAFVAGDVLRLHQVGDLHTLRRNGALAGEWDDTGSTAATGSGYRRMGLRVSGAKDVFGPRRFSPALDYIECA